MRSADTDGTEQHSVVWVLEHELPDSLPEQQQRLGLTLILNAYKCASEFRLPNRSSVATQARFARDSERAFLP